MKKILIITNNIEIESNFKTVIEEIFSSLDISIDIITKEVNINDKDLVKEVKNNYEFVFWDIDYLEFSSENLCNILNKICNQTNFIIVTSKKNNFIYHKHSLILGTVCLTEKMKERKELLFRYINNLINISYKTKQMVRKTNKVIEMCENIKTIAVSEFDAQEILLNEVSGNEKI